MISKARIISLLCVSFWLVDCRSRSDAKGEVVAIGEICKYEKRKIVAVEGYVKTTPTDCRKTRRTRRAMGGTVLGCRFDIYADSKLSGPSLSVEIDATRWPFALNNRVADPLGSMKLFDNDGNPVPPGSKLRISGSLLESPRCEFGTAQRIDRIP